MDRMLIDAARREFTYFPGELDLMSMPLDDFALVAD
jgi:hypothetical protein